MTYQKSQKLFVCVAFLGALFLCLLASDAALAQTGLATLNGQVFDAQHALVANASVTLASTTTATERSIITNNDGSFVFEALQPDIYSLYVTHEGFAVTNVKDLTLHTADNVAVAITLKVGSINTEVAVNSSSLTNNSSGVSLTVSREFIDNMPLNGRSFQDLIQLAPGTVSTTNGYYSVNGQRTDSNNYMVDGVSANLGGYNNLSSTSIGSGLSGSTPSQTYLGTTQSLTSVDSLAEFTIQTSGYAAEYGRNPGGQVQLATRSGTNNIHGTIFDYLRNTSFDANSFANDYHGDPKTPEHQNDFGGTIGGPLVIPLFHISRGKAFYFVSYEGLRLLTPAYESEYVPTQAFRLWASPNVQPFLNAVPLPSANSPSNQDGCTIPNPTSGEPTACDSLFNYGYSYPGKFDNVSGRLDQNIGPRLHAFLRYANTPSSKTEGAESKERYTTNTQSVTAGATATVTTTMINDLRFNYSRDTENESFTVASVGGSVPYSRDLLIPTNYDSAFAAGAYRISVTGTSLSVYTPYENTGSALRQYQVLDSLAWARRNHNVKVGIDWRRLKSFVAQFTYSSSETSTALPAIQQGYANTVQITASNPGEPVFNNLSLYAEDQWKVLPGVTIDYGVRWEFNPPPGSSNGRYPVTLTSTDLATAGVTNDSTQPYKTQYHSFAPRFGVAWNAIPSESHALTVRGGFGIFFDTGQAEIGQAYYGSYPFQVTAPTRSNVVLPFSQAAMAPPALNSPLTPPFPDMNVTSPDLTLPYTENWNVSLDESLNAKNALTVSYVGNSGRRLLFTESYDNIPDNKDFTVVYFTNNGSQSNYNALQVQDVGRVANGLDLVASFTWAHALDNASSDYGSFAPVYGNSDYDLRRVLNLALNYQSPDTGMVGWIRTLTRQWLFGNRFAAQSGYPLTSIEQAAVTLPNGSYVKYLPDLISGVPIYLHGHAADVNSEPTPGSWRLNPAAFACVPTTTGKLCSGTPLRQGTLGRNYVRDPSFWALNTSVQRTFSLHERLDLNFRADAFNVFNHPNLYNPYVTSGALASPTFGQLTTGIATIGSSNSFYAMGAARSLQFSLKLQF